MIKVLYLYDVEEWALYNVGKYWAQLLAGTHDFSFVKIGRHSPLEPTDYDYVWFGCTFLAGRYLRVKHLLANTHLMPRKWLPRYNSNFVSVIHDPCEIFPQIPGWREAAPFLDRLAHFSRLAVISNEMQGIMARLGFDCKKINTKSALPIRELSSIPYERLAVFSRANTYPRKNIELFLAIQAEGKEFASRFDGVFDRRVLPVRDYVSLIDQYNCYICTSWQEGGPLPLMDAVCRGCTVLTTEVGQSDEWVEHGVNGFFCSSKRDFLERIRYLARNEDMLRDFRARSLALAATKVDDAIRTQVLEFLTTDSPTSSRNGRSPGPSDPAPAMT